MSVLVINDTRVDMHHGCYAVMATIGELLERQALGPSFYWPAHAEWRNNPDFEAVLAKAKLVVINGEGTIHHDRPAGRRLLEAGKKANDVNVPVALINTGWEGNGLDLQAMLDTSTWWQRAIAGALLECLKAEPKFGSFPISACGTRGIKRLRRI